MPPRSTRINPETPSKGSAQSFVQILDGYYRPARDRRKEQALQEGISDLTSIFAEKQRENIKDQRENEYQQGVLDAHRETAGKELEGVKTGSIFRQDSKYYTAGLNESRGRKAAYEFKAQLERDYLNWEGKNSDDPNAIRQWVDQRTAEFLETLGDDQHKVAGAMPVLQEATYNLASKHRSYTNKRLEYESKTAYTTSIFGEFESYRDRVSQIRTAGYSEDVEEQLVKEARQNTIQQWKVYADEQYATEGPEANKQLVDTAVQAAVAYNDMSPITMIIDAEEAGEMKLSPEMVMKLKDGADNVGRQTAAERRRLDAEKKRNVDQVNKELMSNFSAAQANDPTVKPPAYHEVVAAGGDYQAFTRMQTMHEGILNSQGEGAQPEAMNDLHDRVSSAEGKDEKLKELTKWTQENTDILTPQQYQSERDKIIEEYTPGTIRDQIKDQRKNLTSLLANELDPEFGVMGSQTSSIRDYAARKYNEMADTLIGRGETDPVAIHEKAEEFAVRSVVMYDATTNAGQGVAQMSPLVKKELGIDGIVSDMQDSQSSSEGDKPGETDNASTEGAEDGTEDNEFIQIRDESTDDVSDRRTIADATPEEGKKGAADALSFDGGDEEASIRQGVFDAFTKGTTKEPRMNKALEAINNDPAFEREVNRLATDLGVDNNAILAVIDFETGGTFDPAQKNAAGSSGTGLIQFMANTARGLGTSTTKLSQMSRVEQMQYVRKYFMQHRDQIKGGSVSDVYMAVLYPKAIGKPDSYVLFSSGDGMYAQNSGLDSSGDGTVTKDEASRRVEATYYGYAS